jgi:uncharacterized membrane protein YfcA
MVVTAVSPTVVLAVLIILVAGATNGLAGFGFAVVGTMALATMIDPATAVVFMIIPILSVNISLVRDLSGEQLRSCSRRFGPLIGAALVGTVVGMAVLDTIPAGPLRLGLGVLTLGFVGTTQQTIPLPEWLSLGEDNIGKSRLGMVGVGGISGLLFGGTNVGVQLIAYLRSFDLSHGLFVGVVPMVFLGLNGIRVAVAGMFGLYSSQTILIASLVAVIPAVVGVTVGKYLREAASERARRVVVLGLLSVIGVRLVTAGVGIA